MAAARTQKVAGLVFGIAFGFWLSWTRFTSYDVIQGALLFNDFYMWLMFPTAVVASAAGLWLLRLAGARTLATREPITWSRIAISREHVVGSALFGIGWAVAGTCPGPAIAQLGQGHLVGLFTVTGILIGVVIRGRAVATAPEKPAPITGTCSS
jgi:hypothetical protein